MRCHEVDYQIIGDDMQIVEIELDPGETVIAEAGAMNYMDEGIGFEARMGDGSKPGEGVFDKLLNVGKRVLTGESIFMTHFTNLGAGKKKAAFAAPYPGKIAALDLSAFEEELICQKDAFLCAALRGTGTVFLQSLPFSRMADRIIKHTPSRGGRRRGEGSILGALGDIIDGDRT